MRVVAHAELAVIDGDRDGNVRRHDSPAQPQAANHSC